MSAGGGGGLPAAGGGGVGGVGLLCGEADGFFFMGVTRTCLGLVVCVCVMIFCPDAVWAMSSSSRRVRVVLYLLVRL